MLAVSAGPLCRAGRGDGTRATNDRFFTGRRGAGRATGLGAGAFFLAAGLRADGCLGFGALRLPGFFPLPAPVLDLPLAMLASRCLTDAAHFHTTGGVTSSPSRPPT